MPSSPITCQGSSAWRSSSCHAAHLAKSPYLGKRNSTWGANQAAVERHNPAACGVERSRRRDPAPRNSGIRKRSCNSVPQRTRVVGRIGRTSKSAPPCARNSSCCVRLMRECGGISKARISSRPSRPVGPSGEYSLSMQNSARCVLPVTSMSRLRSRPSISHGGDWLSPGWRKLPEGDFEFVQRIVAGFVDPRRLRRGTDEEARKQVRQREGWLCQ